MSVGVYFFQFDDDDEPVYELIFGEVVTDGAPLVYVYVGEPELKALRSDAKKAIETRKIERGLALDPDRISGASFQTYRVER